MDAIWQFLPNFKLLMLAVLVFVPLERLFALHRQQQLFRKLWKMDALYILLNSAIVGLGIHWLLFATLLLAPMAVPDEFEAWLGSQPFWLQLPLLLIVADLVFYGMHRMFHRVPWMWKFHAVHHSIEELDWLAAHRIHSFDLILTKGASLLPVFALGFSDGPIAAFFFIYSWQTLFIHANVRFEFGLLGRILATPRIPPLAPCKPRGSH